jgi:c-di-GMP-binding flagellar brake protein YcgR
MNTATSQPPAEVDDPHAITSPLEILAILRSIEKNKTLIRAHAQRPNSTFITTLLEILPEQKTITLDSAPQESLNQRLVTAGEALCEASLDNVNVRFNIANIRQETQDGKPALGADFPTQLIRIQRRNSFRIHTPIANPVQCRIRHDNKEIALTLDDISASGLGAFDDGQQLAPVPGQTYKNCVINLPNIGQIDVDLCVAYTEQFETPTGTTRQRIGFSFVNPRGAVANAVQRYVSALERELIAKRKGFA